MYPRILARLPVSVRNRIYEYTDADNTIKPIYKRALVFGGLVFLASMFLAMAGPQIRNLVFTSWGYVAVALIVIFVAWPNVKSVWDFVLYEVRTRSSRVDNKVRGWLIHRQM